MQAREPPPPVRMVELLGGFRISQALYAAAALGVADQLVAGPAPVKALAERAGVHAPSLHRLLRTLVSVGVFTEPEPGVFALTPLGQTLTGGQPGSMRDLAIMWMETHYAPFAELIHAVRTGRPAAEHLYGEPFFAWLSHHPEQASRFTGAIANLTSGGFKTAAIASLPLDGTRTIVDVGGADGTVLAAILAGHPHMRGVLFDLPHVITSAPRTLARHGVDDRVECVGGDFFESVPADGDAYLVSVVLHNWPDQQSRAHPGQHRRRRRQRRTAADDRVRGATGRHSAPIQDVRPEHARHAGRQGTHRNRMAGTPHSRGLHRHRNTPDRHTIVSHPGNSAIANSTRTDQVDPDGADDPPTNSVTSS